MSARWSVRRAWPAALLGALVSCAAAPHAGADLERALAELQDDPALAGGRVGVAVVDAEDGRCLLADDADRGFATASNMKLLTAAVALRSLGTDAVFTTRIDVVGEVRDGVLHGDLVLVGGGDPTLGGAGDVRPGQLVAAVLGAGIRRIAGAVVGDGSWLGDESLGLGWQWDYLADDYAAPFGGLCWAGNVVALRVEPGDGAAVVTWRPASAPVAAAVATTSAGSPTRIDAGRALGSSTITVTGSIARGAPAWTTAIAVADPAVAAAAELAALLAAAGVVVDGGARRGVVAESVAGRRTLAEVRSAPVAEMVVPMLRHSDNLFAEQLWRCAARAATGRPGTAAAARHAEAVLAELGVATDGMVLADGSGLSRRNLLRPRQLVDLLAAMRHSVVWAPFRAGLPVAGVDGTLRSRFASGPARGRVCAKTGYIARVVCLSGYVPRPDPAAAPLVFSVMLNDFTCDEAAAKAAVDRFVDRLAVFAGWSEPRTGN